MGGNQSAKNIIDLEMNNVVSQISSNIVNSKSSGGASNHLDLGSTCVMDGVTINQTASFTGDISVLQQAATDQGLSQEISTAMQQMAENLTQNVSLNLTNQMTEQVMNLCQDMSLEMINENVSNCIADVFAENTINCSGNISNSEFNQEAVAKLLSSCYQKVESRQELENVISTALGQKSSNKVDDAIAGIISSATGPLLIILAGLFLILMIKGKAIGKVGKSVMNPTVLIVLMGIIAVIVLLPQFTDKK